MQTFGIVFGISPRGTFELMVIVCTHFIQAIVVLVKMVKERLARIGTYLRTCGCMYVWGLVYVYEIMYTFLIVRVDLLRN